MELRLKGRKVWVHCLVARIVGGVVERRRATGVSCGRTGGGRVLATMLPRMLTSLLLLLLLLLLSLPRSVAGVVGSIGLASGSIGLIVIVVAGAGHAAWVLVAGVAGRGGLTRIALVAGRSGLTSSEAVIESVPGGGRR